MGAVPLSLLLLFTFSSPLFAPPPKPANACIKSYRQLGKDWGEWVVLPPRDGGYGAEGVREYLRTGRGWEVLRKGFYRSIEGFEPTEGRPAKTPVLSGLLEIENLKGKKILDVGTGDGEFVRDLRARGIDAVGLDIALRPEQRGQGFFIEADGRKTGLPARSYDLIVNAYNTFHYPEQNAFHLEMLDEQARLLKKGGYAVILQARCGLEIFRDLKKFQLIHPTERFANDQYIILKKK